LVIPYINRVRQSFSIWSVILEEIVKSLISRIKITIGSGIVRIVRFVKKTYRLIKSGWKKHITGDFHDDLDKKKSSVGTRAPDDYIEILSKGKPSDKDKPWLKHIPLISRQASLTELPRLSQQLLLELFGELGVEYIPEIVLHESQLQDSVSIFVDFCQRFDYPDGKPATLRYLQDIVLFLFEMDELRRRHPLNPDPIYKKLEQHQRLEAENLLTSMEEAINLLDKLDSSDELLLGKHRQILNDIKDILSSEWFDNIDDIDKLYDIHLEWQESEKQYHLLQEQIVIRIRTIDEDCQIVQEKIVSAYQNLKHIWGECTAFLEEEEGNPDDPKRGFSKLELIRDALDIILKRCDESVSEPVEESRMSLDKAWEILEMKLDTLDLNLIKRAYRRMAMKNHPDRHPDSEKAYYHKKFIQIQQAYKRLQEECRYHG